MRCNLLPTARNFALQIPFKNAKNAQNNAPLTPQFVANHPKFYDAKSSDMYNVICIIESDCATFNISHISVWLNQIQQSKVFFGAVLCDTVHRPIESHYLAHCSLLSCPKICGMCTSHSSKIPAWIISIKIVK